MPPTQTPWILAGAAVVCYALLMLVQPWRRAFGAGWSFCRRWQRTWLIIGLIGAHQVWWQTRHQPLDSRLPHDFLPAFANEVAGKSALAAGDSVAATLAQVIPPEPISALLAVAILTNFSGLARAFFRGGKVAFERWGTWLCWGLVASGAMHLASLLLDLATWLPASSWGGRCLSAAGWPWVGATAAFALGWLVRFIETDLASPEEILQIQWAGSAAGRILRLWPYVLGSALAAALGGRVTALPNEAQWWVRGPVWMLCATSACLPLLLVHWRGQWGWRPAFHEARLRLMRHVGPLFAWMLLAWLHFLLLHLATEGIASGFPDGNIWQLAWRTVTAYIHAAMLVWLAASWIAMQKAWHPHEPAAPKGSP